MFEIRRILIFAIATILLLLPTNMATSFYNSDQLTFNQQWQTYTDPVFGFSISYPSSWYVIPRNDTLGAGATLTIIDNPYQPNSSTSADATLSKVEIGTYLVEANSDQSLMDWTLKYEQISQYLEQPTNQNLILIKTPDKGSILQARGSSNVTEYRFSNIVRGKIVWFIWSNIPDSKEGIYNRIVESLRFNLNAPYSLQEVYGERFHPFAWSEFGNLTSILDQNRLFSPDKNPVIPLNLGYWWHAPLRGTNLIATCNSPAHNSSWSRYAIDVARPQGIPVFASSSDPVVFAGWNNAGYGNLVRTQGGVKAYYAHLYSINWELIYSRNYNVQRGDVLGWVGSTGNSTGNHLHFEVRNLSDASIRLNGMTGFTPVRADYAYPDNPCGTISYP